MSENNQPTESVDASEHDRKLQKLEKINAALMNRVERSMAQQGNAYSLFQSAIGLESQVRIRTEQLKSALEDLARTNEQLVEARNASDRANRVKTHFFTAVGHDLLQPLHAARLSVSALDHMSSPDEHKRLTMQIDRALLTIEDLLKTILDLSKLEAGVLQPTFQAVHLGDLFDSLQREIEPIADEKGLTVIWHPTPLSVRSDPLMLRRILQNLLANAARYTNEGAIGLEARRRPGGQIEVAVWDTGPGIAEADRGRIFDEFQRGSNLESKASTGFGLGLSIVQRMSEALGHTVHFETEIGEGTRFQVMAEDAGDEAHTTMATPASAAVATGSGSGAGTERTVRGETLEPQPQPQVVQSAQQMTHDGRAAYAFPKAHVVVIDNDRMVLDAMEGLLQRWGCSVVGFSSIDGITRWVADTRISPQIILADYHLDSDTNGTDAIEALRSVCGQDIPAIIITADHALRQENITAGLSGGAVHVMRKPVKPAELRALMLHLLSPTADPQP